MKPAGNSGFSNREFVQHWTEIQGTHQQTRLADLEDKIFEAEEAGKTAEAASLKADRKWVVDRLAKVM